MRYKTRQADARPTQAPEQFEVVQVGDALYIYCPIRRRAYVVTQKPEEIVRQRLLYELRDHYKYSWAQMAVEVPVIVGSTEAKKKADIVVYKDDKKKTPRVFIEVKQPSRNDGLEQLKVYMNATGCRLGMWSNGKSSNISLLRIEPVAGEEEATWRELRNIPAANETLSDVDSPIVRADLQPVDDLLAILKDCENFIKAHEGSDPFDEIFKLIFAKLFDERRNLKNDASPAQFRIGAMEAEGAARHRVTKLFNAAKQQWAGVFSPGDAIDLGDDSLAYCISALQMSYLLKSDADVLGAAFEVMINPSMKSDKGQYFTPRHVINLCIEILDPKDDESVFDPACGSGGFLVGALEHVFRQIEIERDDANEIMENQKDYANQNVFGIDYDPRIARVAKAYMLIWGDGRANICVADGLNEKSWNTDVQSRFLHKQGGRKHLRQFDIIVTNPPFAGAISAVDTLSLYDLAYTTLANGRLKRLSSVDRDILFIERCLKSLVPGGRMAIVLPRGLFKNYGDEAVRRYILREAQVRAVIGLSGQMFKPFTNTKTCVLFLKKRATPLEDLEYAKKDPEIVFAMAERSGKDRSGRIMRFDDGTINSDLPEIVEYVRNYLDWKV